MRIAALFLSCVFVSGFLAACSVPDDPATAAYWIDRLDDKKKRNEALKKIGQIGDKTAVPEVMTWFTESGDWQPDAAYALGQLGDPSVVQPLVQHLDFQVGAGRDRATTRKNRTNQNIARALAMLEAKEGVEPLIRLLDTRELKTKEAVIRSLGKLQDSRAAEPLIEIALEEPQPFIRKTAIQALGDLGDPKGVPAAIQMLFVELPGTSFYFEARFSLLQIGPAATPALIETMRRKNQVIEKITTATGEPIAEGAIEAKAAFVLGTLRAKEAEGAMVEALTKYFKKYQREKNGLMHAGTIGAVMELCYALGSMGSQKAIPILQSIAADTDANIRVSATEALVTIGSKKSVPTLLKVAKTGPTAARRYAIEAVSLLGSGKDLGAFEGLAKAGDKTVPAEDLAKMVGNAKPRLVVAKECGDDAACWKGKLTDTDGLVRERAAYELGWSASKDAQADLVKLIEDDEATVRLAAIWSLSAMDDGLDADALQKLYDTWYEKVDYKNPNANLRRLIARLKSKQTK